MHIRATNVELTEYSQQLISTKLLPLARYLQYEPELRLDVVLRKMRSSFRGDVYCVSVKLMTPRDTFVAVANERHLPKALTRVRETLRRSISKGSSLSQYQLRRDRQLVRVPDYSLAAI